MKYYLLVVFVSLMAFPLNAQEHLTESLKYNKELKQCHFNLTKIADYATNMGNAAYQDDFNNYMKNREELYKSLTRATDNIFQLITYARTMRNPTKITRIEILDEIVQLMIKCYDKSPTLTDVIKQEAEIAKNICSKEISY